jgi:tetratricopeptide (TPR) repeat protein/KaiC/GvpD/RAD55 family RecA-like ATPase
MRRQIGPNPLKVIEERLRVFEEEYSLWDTALGLLEVANVSSTSGQAVKGVAAYLRSIALFDELGDLRWQGRLRIRFGMAYWMIPEAFDSLAKSVDIFEKIGEYGMLSEAHATWAFALEARGNLQEAVSRSLKALEYSKKTDSTWGLSIAYANLVREYTKLGDQEHADEYFKKFMDLPPSSRHPATHFSLSLAVYFAGKNLWTESNQYFKKHLEAWKDPYAIRNYAWALAKQGRTEDAKVQLAEIEHISAEFRNNIEHVNLQADLMAPWKVVVGEEFEIRLTIVNVSKKPGVLLNVKSLLLPELTITSTPANCRLENNSVEMMSKNIDPFHVETFKFRLKASKPGVLTFNPQVTYKDETGETRTSISNSITVTVQPAKPKYEILPGRIPTGYAELDALLLGGIPQNHAVALTSPSTDEREQLVKKFLETGVTAGEIVFDVTAKAKNAEEMAEKYPSNFYLFICNPQAEAVTQSLPNVLKLKGVENLTEIDIALTKAFRALDPSSNGPKRICIEVVSDVLLQYHALNTRRWLSALLPTLKMKGFTILAVVDIRMHPLEETQAVLDLFDGEITINEKETPKGTERFLNVKRLSNQKYAKDEILLKGNSAN